MGANQASQHTEYQKQIEQENKLFDTQDQIEEIYPQALYAPRERKSSKFLNQNPELFQTHTLQQQTNLQKQLHDIQEVSAQYESREDRNSLTYQRRSQSCEEKQDQQQQQQQQQQGFTARNLTQRGSNTERERNNTGRYTVRSDESGNYTLNLTLNTQTHQKSNNSTRSRIRQQDMHLSQLMSVSIVKSEFVQFMNTKDYKFRMIIQDLFTGISKEIYVKKGYTVTFGRKKGLKDFQQIDDNFVNLTNKSISQGEHTCVKLNPNQKIIFTIQDLGSFNGTFLKVDEAELQFKSLFQIGQSIFSVYYLNTQEEKIQLYVTSGPYKGQKKELSFLQTDFYQFGKDNQQNILNLERDENLCQIHCKIYFKRKYRKYYIKDMSQQGGIWMRLNEPRDEQPSSANTPDNSCFKLGNAYKVSLNWKTQHQ